MKKILITIIFNIILLAVATYLAVNSSPMYWLLALACPISIFCHIYLAHRNKD